MIETVFFDLRGVLIDRVNDDILCYAAAALGVEQERLKQLYEGKYQERLMTGNLGEREMWSRICRELGIPPTGRLLWEEGLQRFYRPHPDGFQLAGELHEGGHTLALITDSEPSMGKFLAEDCYDLFRPHIFASYEQGCMKPELYRRAQQAMELRPEGIVVMDDQPQNIDDVVRMGMRGIQFQNVQQASELLREKGVKI